MYRFGFLAGILFAIAGMWPGGAISADVTDSEAVLKVEVHDADRGTSRILLWSLKDLCDMPQEAIQTTTPWTSGPQRFSGVEMADLLEEIGVTEGEVELWASNDYSVVTDAETLRDTGAVLALRRNGSLMNTRNKGPLWLVWDYDASSSLRTETIYALSVWQLDRIRVSQ